MKRIILSVMAAAVVASSAIAGATSANAVTAPKVCYYDNPTELRYTINSSYYGGLGFLRTAVKSAGPTIDLPQDIALDSASFSGDCPSNAQPTTNAAPPYYFFRDADMNETFTWGDGYNYYGNGAKKFKTPLQYVLEGQGGIRWTPTTRTYYGYEVTLNTYLRPGAFNTQINQRESALYMNYNNYGYLPEFLNRWITMQPSAANSVNVWTGNAATQDCVFDASTCPGGYVFADYVVVPKNPVSVKWKTLGTLIDAKAGKKSGNYFTATVNVDRLYTDAKGNDVKRYPGDKVTVMRGTKVVGTAKVNKNGVAKIRIKDVKGDNTYTVTIPETNRNWDASTTFVK